MKGAAEETAAHHADEEDETAMEGAKAVPAPLPSQPQARDQNPQWRHEANRGLAIDVGAEVVHLGSSR